MIDGDKLVVGAEVVRVQGTGGVSGSRGRIVEVRDSRVRVFWHTPQPGWVKPKRTWVSRRIVRLVSEAT